jgi:hypothetical protein
MMHFFWIKTKKDWAYKNLVHSSNIDWHKSKEMFSVFRYINVLKAIQLLYYQTKKPKKTTISIVLKKQKATPRHRFLFQLTN